MSAVMADNPAPNDKPQEAPKPKPTAAEGTKPSVEGVMKRIAPIVTLGYKYSSIVILVVCCLIAFGIYALKEMNKNEFPNFTIREGLLVAVYPGATSEQMEQEVLKPLEDFVFSYKEVKKSTTHSEAMAGMVIIYVELDDNVDDTEGFWNKFAIAAQQEKLSLPAGVLATEVISTFGDTSSLLITMSSTDKSYREMHQYMERLKARIRTVSSVGQISVMGEQHEQIAVYLDPHRLAKYSLGERTIAVTLVAQGFSTTSGSLRSHTYTMPIDVKRPLNTVKAVEDQIVFTGPEGQIVRLGDVADVRREYPTPTSYVTNNGVNSIVLSVSVKEGHNVVTMGRAVEKEIEAFEAEQLPEDVKLFRITNQPYDVHASVLNFLMELLIAVIGVVVAIMILLPFRVALIAALTIPITIFISLGAFFALGIELNTVTLACLIVSLGMIVDNSVVIIDNYVELLSEGVDRKTATLSSATEFYKAIISATLAISITFFPFLLTMKGMFRDFLTDFPWGITIILFISLFIAELLVPVMQYKLIKDSKVTSGPNAKGVKHFSILGALYKGYDKLIDWCFRWPKTVLTLGIGITALGIYVLVVHPMKLMPVAERNQFAVEIFMPTGTALERTVQVADSLEALISKDKRVVSVASFKGCSSPRFMATFAPQVGGANYAQFIVNTTGNSQTVDLLNEFTPKYETYFPDAVIRFVQLNYSQAAHDIEVRVSGHDMEAIRRVSDTVFQIMQHVPGLTIPHTSLNAPQMSALIEPDGDAMSRLGLDATALQLTMALRYGTGIPVAKVWEGDYGIPVTLKTPGAARGDVSDLLGQPVPLPLGQEAPLNQFAKVTPRLSLGTISHRNGVRTVDISAEIERGLNALDLTRTLRHELKDVKLPAGVTISYGGAWDETMTLLPQLGGALLMAAVIIFFILLFHYRKVRVSLLMVVCLITTLPGAALGVAIQGVPLSLTCTLGIISLMGIMVRNVIILFDYAEELQRTEGLDLMQSILASSKRRMRPIVLTSTAAAMGVIPMAISASGLWQPMGAVIFWGTLLTLVYILTFIPIAYWKTQPQK